MPLDPLVDEAPSRFVVGIDLGTTNSAVAYVDTSEAPWQVRVFALPQLVAAGEVQARETLPSFHYQPPPSATSAAALQLPWSPKPPNYAVGILARDEGLKTPGRLIASAKSWLCHAGVDRTADLLPWQGAADVERLSPVEVTARYLRHIRDAWNATFAGEPLAEQQLVIPLPASFDEVARELTVEAAAASDLPRVVLIEEPQAAFYAWVYKHAGDWQQRVAAGEKILVCDIGGGTSDFTLIHAKASDSQGEQDIVFHRVAVGEHLILGGDNLDLALAHYLENKLGEGAPLPSPQWEVLVRSARRVKETLLGEDRPAHLTMHLPGVGSKLLGSGAQLEIVAEEVVELLLEGFLPRVGLAEKPHTQTGFQEFGLPYAADHGITRYLAEFLSTHRHTAEQAQGGAEHDPARPDVVLFNGGFFASPLLRERLVEVLTSWFQPPEGSWQPKLLEHDRLDLAVARGAAYYGMVRRGEGVRITANLARSYYIGVEHDQPAAVCLVPGDAQPGQEIELPDTSFQLRISEPVEFPLYVSSTRLTDQPGELVAIDRQQLRPLPPIRTVLQTSRRSETGQVPVHLHTRLTEIGTMEMWCSQVGHERSWRLQFDIRSATQTDVAAHGSAAEGEGFVDEAKLLECQALLEAVFSADGQAEPAKLMKQLAQTLQTDRAQWPTSLLRRIWETLMELEAGRRRSAAHEARWLNLLGYALRPGYGFAVDDWRVAETWRRLRDKLVFHASSNQALILWRRIAGGLSRGQQLAIAEPAVAAVRALHRRYTSGGQRGGELTINAAESAEIWRLLGSLELLAVPLKQELGDMILALVGKRKLQKVRDAMVWSLGRLGQRIPVYGPLNTVVPQGRTAKWLRTLWEEGEATAIELLATMQMARRTGDRHRDLENAARHQAIAWLESHHAPHHFLQLVREGGRLDHEEQDQVVGETLPKGLRMPVE